VDELRGSTTALIRQALRQAGAVKSLAGVPLRSGWEFHQSVTGLREARTFIAPDLMAMWRDSTGTGALGPGRAALRDALLGQHHLSLEQLGRSRGALRPQAVASMLTNLVMHRAAGLLDGSGRWDEPTGPDGEQIAERVCEELEALLDGVPAVADIVVPLRMCDTDLASAAAVMHGVRLVPLGVGEVTRLLAGTVGTFSGPTAAEALDWECAVVTQAKPDVAGTTDAAMALATDTVLALRLLRHSAVAAPHFLIRPHGLSLVERGSGLHLGLPTWGPGLHVTAGDLAAVAATMSERPSSRSGRLALALRRLASSDSRRDHGDRLVDFWVGLEALYAPDGTAELKFRAAVRLAHALEPAGPARRALFDAARKSYDLRSKLVHGDPKGPDKATADAANEAEDWLRRSILRWWSTGAGPSPAQLDAELFPETDKLE
jgi:hypothetical protein